MARRLIKTLEELCDDFAAGIIALRKLAKKNGETTIAGQLMRSGTSVGANVAEAKFPQTRGDYISKLSIALKEASETHYWIRMLDRQGIVAKEPELAGVKDDCETIMAKLQNAIHYAKIAKARELAELEKHKRRRRVPPPQGGAS